MMDTNEIIRRLELVRNAYEANLYGRLPKREIDTNVEAQNLGIQAVRTLKKVKDALEANGSCIACTEAESLDDSPVCQECKEVHYGINWEWRWPLEKDTDQ